MSDPTSDLKSHAKHVKNELTYLNLSHGQLIEILVALLTEEKSWNHCCASKCSLTIPDNLIDYFNSIARGQRRLAQFQGQQTTPGDRGERSLIMMDILSIVMTGSANGFAALNELIDRADYENKAAPMRIDNNGNLVPISAKEHPEMAMVNLGSWFFRNNLRIGNYPWDITEKLAIKKGFSVNKAGLIRMLQREAPNHSWPIDLWFEVGVLDGDQDKFLEELKNDQTWEKHFQALYHHDGHYELGEDA